jgi:AcrR family transcriptional regulator
MTEVEVGHRGVGRPRSVEADEAILAAVLGELVEVGFDELTIERVATRASVGKATIYRRWSSKTDLVVDALGSLKPPLVHPDTGSTRDDLVQLFGAAPGKDHDPDSARLLVGLCMELQRSPEMGEMYRERFAGPRRQVAAEVLARGVERGEIRPDIDPDEIVDLLVGPLFYRQLVAGRPVDAAGLSRIVDLVLAGITA